MQFTSTVMGALRTRLRSVQVEAGGEPLWSCHPERLVHEIRHHGPVDPCTEAHAELHHFSPSTGEYQRGRCVSFPRQVDSLKLDAPATYFSSCGPSRNTRGRGASMASVWCSVRG